MNHSVFAVLDAIVHSLRLQPFRKRAQVPFPRLVNSLQFLLYVGVVSLGVLPIVLKPDRAVGAEQVSVTYGLLEFSLTVDELETFANTGEVRGGLRLYARFLDEQGLADLRQFLQQRFDVSPFVISQLTYSQIGEEVLQRLGTVIRTDANLDGFYALRSAMILAADHPEGLTMINFLRQYPSPSLRISAQQLLQLRREFTAQLAYRDAAVEAIRQAAQAEIGAAPELDLSQLPALEEPGEYAVEQRTLNLNRDRQTLLGETIERRFRVLLYLPAGLEQPAPVVVISHGLGSTPEAFAYIGEHLASHGFVAVLPQHIGSDQSRREAALAGILNSAVTPVEFVDRPFDISYTLDQLEQLSASDPDLVGRINTEQVGVIGHSFGGYTALALAGANLSTQDLGQLCDQTRLRLDTSFILQCTAQELPAYTYQLRDPRVKAVVAISPLTSLVFGVDGISAIQIPTMIVSGSSDFIASAVQEQIHPFLWLTTPEKYLALIIPSSHTFADNTPTDGSGNFNRLGLLLSGPDPELGQQYIRELSLAFMQTHLNDQPQYQAALTASYAQVASQVPLELELVRSLTPEQLETAFGRQSPIPIFPAATAATTSDRAGYILEEIAQTGVLKAGIRTDAAPLGYLDANGQPAGFCVDLLNAFTEQLEQQLNTPLQLEIAVQSNLSNRFEIIQDGQVQVECGPNTIRSDVPDVTFSAPFFLTGTQFLVRNDRQGSINPLGQLTNVRVGVLSNTTTEGFIQQRYPNAQIVNFEGATGRTEAVQALAEGAIDLFASDGILLLGEAQQQNLTRADYNLVPRGPLTCDPYGLILPADDPEWSDRMNEFLISPVVRDLRTQWFTQEVTSYLFLTLDYCIQ
ncbi:MAG: hypothetical protein Kow00121_53210 [Elainellaceae cyanobacterium]